MLAFLNAFLNALRIVEGLNIWMQQISIKKTRALSRVSTKETSKTHGISHSYRLNQSISVLRVVASYFSFFLI